MFLKLWGGGWDTDNCGYLADVYDQAKDNPSFSDDYLKYNQEYRLIRCQRRKAMYNMEYTSFIFNIVIGFVCGLLGLLHLFDLKKEFVSKTGLIGLGCGVVGFVLAFVYVIYNGIVYTTYYDTSIPKRDSDGVFAELKGNGNFECLYYDSKENDHALIAKYSDLIQKQYNYDKDLIDSYKSISDLCKIPSAVNQCSNFEGQIPKGTSTCTKFYVEYDYTIGVTNKDISDRFLTTLLLSLFVCLANIGLALFGFLLFRTPGEF